MMPAPRQTNDYWSFGAVTYLDIRTKAFPQAIGIIDSADVDLIIDGGGRWRAMGEGEIIYVRRTGLRPQQKCQSIHEMISGNPLTDHRNHDGLDNRRDNLRPATRSQNGANRRNTKAGGRFKGVFQRKKNGRLGRYRAGVMASGKMTWIGTFDTALEAARAYDEAAIAAFGEFAYPNLPRNKDV